MQELLLAQNNISGTLPVEWGQSGVFPELAALELYQNQLTGGLAATCTQLEVHCMSDGKALSHSKVL